MGKKRRKNQPKDNLQEQNIVENVKQDAAEDVAEDAVEDVIEDSKEDIIIDSIEDTIKNETEDALDVAEEPVMEDAKEIGGLDVAEDPESADSYVSPEAIALYEELKQESEAEHFQEGSENDTDLELDPDLETDIDLEDNIPTEQADFEEPYHDESLKSFIAEMRGNAKLWMRKNKSFCIFTALALIVCIAVIILAGHLNKNNVTPPDTVSINTASTGVTATSDAIPLPPDPLAEDAIPEINELINRYFDSMQSGDLDTFLSIRSYTDSVEKAKFEAKCDYIESYDNIHCYTKPGPYEASYMVYVTYDLKLKDWEKPAPALVTLVVCTDQENHLYIYSGGFDENVVDYIRGVTSQEDVYALITKVQTEYQEVVDSDAAFAEYMSVLNQMIKDGVGVRLAAAAEAGIQPEDSVSVSDQTVAEVPGDLDGNVSGNEAGAVSGNTVSENTSDSPSNNTSFQVRTTATVNVRMSDSENADKLGKAENGMELTCLEQMQNGWSKVLFDGKTGYIKTDYLVAVGTQTETGQQNTVVGKVTVMSSVNIRGSADMDGNVLGKAYPGTSFDVIAKDWNGWTTILYNGKTAYIRTEYVEFKAN